MIKNAILIFTMVIIAFSAKAADNTFVLSDFAQFYLKDMGEFSSHPFPSTNATVFYNSKESIAFYVSRTRPNYMANQAYVARQWNKLTNASRDNLSLPKACKKHNPIRFECSRIIKHSETEFELQTFYWDSIKDTVFVQLKAKSEQKLNQWKKKFSVKFRKGEKL